MAAEPEVLTGVIKPIEVYKEAWEAIKNDFWMIFLITFVGLIVGSFVPIIIVGPMICGIYLVLFNVLDGQRPMFEDLFKGFEYFLPSLVVAIVSTLPVFVFLIAIYIPMVIMMVAGPRMSESEVIPMMIGMIILELLAAIVMVCIHTLLMFAFPLIVDRKLGAIKAMTTSAKAVFKNLGGVAGLFGVAFILGIVGMLLLCIGTYLVLPIIFAANAVAYRKIFPGGSGPISTPPPPNYYQGI